LPPEVLGKARVKLQRRLSMHDWIATDCHELEKLEDKFAKVLARL
jgi:hypothetical protein